MRYRNLHRPLLLLWAFSLWSLTPVQTAMADITYDVTVNTLSLTGTSGYIDFQFNPANPSSLFATANLSNFATDGVVGAQAFQSGDATGPGTGPLTPPPLSFDNGTALNELTYNFVYGSTISFDMTLSGTALSGGAPAGASSTFALTLLDGGGNAFSTGPGGAIVTIVVNPDGSTTGTAYSPIATGGPAGTVTMAGTVPEPSTLVLGVIAFGALFGCHQVRRRAAA
jgi:hypothetical protein